jgi:hypothetical protein
MYCGGRGIEAYKHEMLRPTATDETGEEDEEDQIVDHDLEDILDDFF